MTITKRYLDHNSSWCHISRWWRKSTTTILNLRSSNMQTQTLYHFWVIARFSSNVTNFIPPHLHFEFRSELWCQKTIESRGYGYRVVLFASSSFSRFDTIYRSVTDTHTHTLSHTQTDRRTHDDGIYTALSIASRGKNLHCTRWFAINRVLHGRRLYRVSHLQRSTY